MVRTEQIISAVCDAIAECIGVQELEEITDSKQLFEIALATFAITHQTCLQFGLSEVQTVEWLTTAANAGRTH